jgi:hypothetical protein
MKTTERKRLNIALPADTYDQLQELADMDKRNVTGMIIALIDRAYKDYDRRAGYRAAEAERLAKVRAKADSAR